MRIVHLGFCDGPVVKNLPSNARGSGLITGRGAKIQHASGPKHQNIKHRQCWNKFNKDFQNGPHQKKKRKRIVGPSRKNRITSLCPMQDTACLGLVHGDDPEGCCGKGGGRGVHVWDRMYTSGGFMSMYGKSNTSIIK